MSRAEEPQPSLPLDLVPQQRHKTAETKAIHSAVLALRAAGFSVYRNGPTQHRIDGALADHRQLRALASRIST